MRTLCDVCEKAAAVFFCAADEAALCPSCDDKVHMCNKLASRHVRVRIAESKAVPRCDICESSPAFFYCEIDGSSLCLQCDMVVHVGGKRTHRRYLLLRQRVEFPTDKPGQFEDPASRSKDAVQTGRGENIDQQNHRKSSGIALDTCNGNESEEGKMIDLNIRPYRLPENSSNNQGIISKAVAMDTTWKFLSKDVKHSNTDLLRLPVQTEDYIIVSCQYSLAMAVVIKALEQV